MSTPINQIRNGGGMNGLQPQSTQQPSNNMMRMPIYNPNPPQQAPNNQLNMQENMQGNINQPLMPANGSSSQLVDDILKEMGNSPGNDELDMNVGNINYSMDNVNVPPTVSSNTIKQLQAEDTHAHQNQEGNQNEYMLSENNVPSTELGNMNHLKSFNPFDNLNLNNLTNNDVVDGLLGTIIKQLKPVAIVFGIVVILSLHQTNRLIFSFIPQLLLENGQLSIYAILLKALLASVLFYSINMLV